jgi:hypothetical protein
MKSKILGLLAVGLLGGLLAVKSAEASLIGSTATCATSSENFSCNVNSATVVDPGVEFQLRVVSNPLWEVDIDADSLTISYVSSGSSGTSGTVYEFGGLLAATGIKNFSTSTEIGSSQFLLSGGVLSADLSGFWTQGSWVRISFDILTTSVPEPATLALLGLGLVGMGYARRRKAS